MTWAIRDDAVANYPVQPLCIASLLEPLLQLLSYNRTGTDRLGMGRTWNIDAEKPQMASSESSSHMSSGGIGRGGPRVMGPPFRPPRPPPRPPWPLPLPLPAASMGLGTTSVAAVAQMTHQMSKVCS